MKFLSHSYRSSNSEFYSLKSRFLVYGKPEGGTKESAPASSGELFPRQPHETPADPNLRELQQKHSQQRERWGEAAEKAEKLQNEASVLANQFNEARKNKKISRPIAVLVFEGPRLNAEKSLQRIQLLKDGKIKPKQRQILNDLEKTLLNLKKTQQEYAENRMEDTEGWSAEELDVYALQYLGKHMETRNRLIEARSELKENKNYQKIESAFDTAAQGILEGENEKFSHFWTNESGYSSPKQEESKKWFLALAGAETTDLSPTGKEPESFANDLLLDLEGMGEDPLKNRTNPKFKDLYQEWLAIKGIKDEWRKEAETALTEQLQIIQQENVPEPDKIAANLQKIKGEGDKPLIQIQVGPQDPKALRDEVEIAIATLERAVHATNTQGEPLYSEDELDTLQEAKKQLLQRSELLSLQIRHDAFLTAQTEKSDRFIYSDLSAPHNRQLRVELAMRRFAAAKAMVEMPFNKTQWGYLHPKKTGMLTAIFYKSGIVPENLDEEGNPKPSATSEDYAWILAEMTQSPFFNASSREKELSPDQREALIYTQAAIHITTKLNQLKAENNPNIKKYQEQAQEFFSVVKKVLKNPRGTEGQQLENRINEGDFGPLLIPQDLVNFRRFQQSVENQYTVLDANESQKELLAQVGIDVQGFHQVYRMELMKDASLNVEKWNSMLYSQDPKEFSKIYNLFKIALPENMEGGKDYFLTSLRVLNKSHKQDGFKNVSPEEALIIQVVQELGLHIRKADEIAAYSDRQNAEIQSRMNGELMVDKFGHLVEGVIDGLRNPYDYTTFASSAIVLGAGGFLVYRMITERGENSSFWLKAARWGVGLTALNVVVEKTTGRGIASLTNINSIAKKMEGTQEAVLLDKGRPAMEKKEISPEQHANAIYQLNKIPFNQLMEWYKHSDENGMPLPGGKDYLPTGIDYGRIYKGQVLKNTNAKMEAARILRAAFEESLVYCSSKDLNRQGNANHGEDLLYERYIAPLKGSPTLAKRNSTLPVYVMDHYKKHPRLLTFEKVMEMEVDLFDIEQTVGKLGVDPALDFLEQTGRGFAEWSREKQGQIRGHVESFMPMAKEQSDKLVNFLGEVGEAGGRQLTFAKNEVFFYLEGKEYRIRQWGKKHLDIIIEGGETVLGGAIALEEHVVDWTLESVKGINKMVNQNREMGKLAGSHLSGEDIAPSESVLGRPGPENPPFAHFGRYQKPFYKAFEKDDHYFLTPPGDSEESQTEFYPDENVGYYISTVSKNDLPSLSPNPTQNEIDSKLTVQSRAAARRFFLEQAKKAGQELSGEDVDRFMYPVHVLQSVDGKDQRVTFWRMPMPGSTELWEKRNGTYAGSLDPKRHLTALPFELDPNADVLEQLANLYRVQIGPMGVLTDFATNIGSRPFSFALRNIEWAGNFAGGIVDFMKEDTLLADIIGDLTQRSPEFKTNKAEFTTDLRYDPWYKESADRQAIYNISLAHAEKYHHRLYLGIFRTEPNKIGSGYSGTRYLNRPPQFQNNEAYYNSLNEFYEGVYKNEKGPNKAFEELIAQNLPQKSTPANSKP